MPWMDREREKRQKKEAEELQLLSENNRTIKENNNTGTTLTQKVEELNIKASSPLP